MLGKRARLVKPGSPCQGERRGLRLRQFETDQARRGDLPGDVENVTVLLTYSHRFDYWFRCAMVGAFAAAILALVGLYYYGPQQYTRVGYAPVQPVPFSHAQHAGQLGLSCLYCHTGVEESPVAK